MSDDTRTPDSPITCDAIVPANPVADDYTPLACGAEVNPRTHRCALGHAGVPTRTQPAGSRITIPEEALRAAIGVAAELFTMPNVARSRNFTREQIEAGALLEAEDEAAQLNFEAVAEVVRAAAPHIVAASIDSLLADARGHMRRDQYGYAVPVSYLRARAAELRGGSDVE